MKSKILNLLNAVLLAALLVTWLFFEAYIKHVWIICNVIHLLPLFFLYDPSDTSEDYGCLFMLSCWTIFFIPFVAVCCLHAALGDQVKTYSEAQDVQSTALRIFCWLVVLAGISALFIMARGVFFAGSAPQPVRSASYAQTTATAAPRRSSPLQTTAPKVPSIPKPTATPKPKTATYKTTPVSWVELTRTVYVSRKGKIHLRKNCSGMKYSTAMSYGEACEKGYDHCQKCF